MEYERNKCTGGQGERQKRDWVHQSVKGPAVMGKEGQGKRYRLLDSGQNDGGKEGPDVKPIMIT